MNNPKLINTNKLNREDLCNFCGSADCANCFEDEAFKKWIVAQPTAYDIDKVVEQLEELKSHAADCADWSTECSCLSFINCEEHFITKAIEIVKKGGDVNDKKE